MSKKCKNKNAKIKIKIENFLKKIITMKNTGSTTILLTVLILSSVLLVALIAGDLVRNGLIMSRTHVHSAKALFAAEAGIEKVLNDIWKPNIMPQCAGADVDSGFVCFSPDSDGSIDVSAPYDKICSDDCVVSFGLGSFDYQNLSNDAVYQVFYDYITDGINSTTTFTSLGSYKEVNRVVETHYNN